MSGPSLLHDLYIKYGHPEVQKACRDGGCCGAVPHYAVDRWVLANRVLDLHSHVRPGTQGTASKSALAQKL